MSATSETISLDSRWEIYIVEGEDSIWDAFLWDDRNRAESKAEGCGKTCESALAALYLNFSDSSTKLPADALVPLRALFLDVVDALNKRVSKRCGAK